MKDSGLNIVPLPACFVKTKEDMKSWFDLVEEVLLNRGELYGRTSCSSVY
jgi:hypothetical protein